MALRPQFALAWSGALNHWYGGSHLLLGLWWKKEVKQCDKPTFQQNVVERKFCPFYIAEQLEIINVKFKHSCKFPRMRVDLFGEFFVSMSYFWAWVRLQFVTSLKAELMVTDIPWQQQQQTFEPFWTEAGSVYGNSDWFLWRLESKLKKTFSVEAALEMCQGGIKNLKVQPWRECAAFLLVFISVRSYLMGKLLNFLMCRWQAEAAQRIIRNTIRRRQTDKTTNRRGT